MLKRILLTLCICFGTSVSFAVTFVPISGDITVTTSSDRRSAAVIVSNSGAIAALFCVAFPEPLEQPITIEERGQVIYLPQPIEGLPPGAQLKGSEPIAQTLTVVPIRSPALAFVAAGVQPIHKGAKAITIASVSRQAVGEKCFDEKAIAKRLPRKLSLESYR